MKPFVQAGRALVRRPAFTCLTVVTLAAGIAASTAMCSIVDAVLLRPLPYPDAGQLVAIYEASPGRRERVSLAAPARIEDWSRLSRSFTAISGSYAESVTDTSGAEPVFLTVNVSVRVSPAPRTPQSYSKGLVAPVISAIPVFRAGLNSAVSPSSSKVNEVDSAT